MKLFKIFPLVVIHAVAARRIPYMSPTGAFSEFADDIVTIFFLLFSHLSTLAISQNLMATPMDGGWMKTNPPRRNKLLPHMGMVVDTET